jgi:hypothetical protein
MMKLIDKNKKKKKFNEPKKKKSPDIGLARVA